MATQRRADVRWQGSLLEGSGTIDSTTSGAFGDLGVTWTARSEADTGGLVNDETIRSLLISHHLLGTQEAIVIGHTDCGMLTFTNDDVHEKLGPKSENIDFQPFPDVAERVRQSVETIRSHQLLPESFGASGFVYDVGSGRIEPV